MELDPEISRMLDESENDQEHKDVFNRMVEDGTIDVEGMREFMLNHDAGDVVTEELLQEVGKKHGMKEACLAELRDEFVGKKAVGDLVTMLFLTVKSFAKCRLTCEAYQKEVPNEG